MTRCEEFYEKWKRDPNWCNKCKTSVFRINKYIELVDAHPLLRKVSERALRPLTESSVPHGELERIIGEIEQRLQKKQRVTTDVVQELIGKPKSLYDICPVAPDGLCWYNKHNKAEFCPLNPCSYINDSKFQEALANCTPSGARALMKGLVEA